MQTELHLFINHLSQQLNLDNEGRWLLIKLNRGITIPEGDSYWWVNPDDLTIQPISTEEEGFSPDLFHNHLQLRRHNCLIHYEIY